MLETASKRGRGLGCSGERDPGRSGGQLAQALPGAGDESALRAGSPTTLRPADDAAAPAVELRDFSAGYGGGAVVNGVNYAATPGSITAIIGPNGAGKSTLLKGMLGLTGAGVSAGAGSGRGNLGSVRFLGEPLPRVRRQVAYMPQTESVDWDFPATALDVALTGVHARGGWLWGGLPRTERRRQALDALDRVGLAERAGVSIGELSGGQRKRVFLARALAQQPRVLLLDEPFAGVDAVSQAAITSVLTQLAASGHTILLVHHDLAAVREFCHAAIVLGYGSVFTGTVPEVFERGHVSEAFGAAKREEQE